MMDSLGIGFRFSVFGFRFSNCIVGTSIVSGNDVVLEDSAIQNLG